MGSLSKGSLRCVFPAISADRYLSLCLSAHYRGAIQQTILFPEAKQVKFFVAHDSILHSFASKDTILTALITWPSLSISRIRHVSVISIHGLLNFKTSGTTNTSLFSRSSSMGEERITWHILRRLCGRYQSCTITKKIVSYSVTSAVRGKVNPYRGNPF